MLFNCTEIDKILKENNSHCVFIVCGKHSHDTFVMKYITDLDIDVIIFSEFHPNPTYEEVANGIKSFKENHCDFIISLGGGSSIDVAKSIKAFVTMDSSKNYLDQQIEENNIKHLAIPTTAGTGSEETQFAVIYYNNEKKSIDNAILKPNYVYLEPKLLETLPLYQKKATMLDALCQGIESYWSVKSTEESKEYAAKAIQLILKNYKDYINGNTKVYKSILLASNYSGKAINISRTTAAHAMSYKLTSLYGISHGHAVAISLPVIMRYMQENKDYCIDNRGIDYVNKTIDELCSLFDKKNLLELSDYLCAMNEELGIIEPILNTKEELSILANSVNEQRLKNNPINITDDIYNIYEEVLKIKKRSRDIYETLKEKNKKIYKKGNRKN